MCIHKYISKYIRIRSMGYVCMYMYICAYIIILCLDNILCTYVRTYVRIYVCTVYVCRVPFEETGYPYSCMISQAMS